MITDAELLALIKTYRDAYFAYEMLRMRRNRDYEHWRHDPANKDKDWDDPESGHAERAAEGSRLYEAKIRAEHALVLTDPPADYQALVAEMQKEFGE